MGDATGHVTANFVDGPFGPGNVHGHVTCLVVSNHRATIGWEYDHSTDPFRVEGRGRYQFIEDGGEPVNGNPVDRVRGMELAAPPQICPPPPTNVGSLIQSGNLTVHDNGA
jgi:hypothetical protein